MKSVSSLHHPECLFLLVFTSCTLLTLFCTLQHFWVGGSAQALERQKEYTDAIRIERDELREEAVKLKDILKVLKCVEKKKTTVSFSCLGIAVLVLSDANNLFYLCRNME